MAKGFRKYNKFVSQKDMSTQETELHIKSTAAWRQPLGYQLVILLSIYQLVIILDINWLSYYLYLQHLMKFHFHLLNLMYITIIYPPLKLTLPIACFLISFLTSISVVRNLAKNKHKIGTFVWICNVSPDFIAISETKFAKMLLMLYNTAVDVAKMLLMLIPKRRQISSFII